MGSGLPDPKAGQPSTGPAAAPRRPGPWFSGGERAVHCGGSPHCPPRPWSLLWVLPGHRVLPLTSLSWRPSQTLPGGGAQPSSVRRTFQRPRGLRLGWFLRHSIRGASPSVRQARPLLSRVGAAHWDGALGRKGGAAWLGRHLSALADAVPSPGMPFLAQHPRRGSAGRGAGGGCASLARHLLCGACPSG